MTFRLRLAISMKQPNILPATSRYHMQHIYRKPLPPSIPMHAPLSSRDTIHPTNRSQEDILTARDVSPKSGLGTRDDVVYNSWRCH